MTFTIKSNELSSICKVFGKVISGKSSMPICDSVMFQSCKNGFMLTASDSTYTWVTKQIKATNIDKPMDVCIEYKWLKNICDNNPNATIHFDIDEDYMIKATTIDGEICGKALSSIEFPPVPEYASSNIHTIDGAELIQAYNEVAFARATDEVRFVMTMIYIDSQEKGYINVVATDGKIMVVKSIYSPITDPIHAMVSVSALNIVAAINPKSVCFSFNDDESKQDYFIACDGYYIYSQKAEGRYPNYKAVMPTNMESYGKCSRLALIAAMKRLAAFGETSTLARLKFVEDGALELTSINNENGNSYTEKMPCFVRADIGISIGCSSTFVLNVLNHAVGNTIKIYYTYPDRPIVLIGADEDLYMLVMPMNNLKDAGLDDNNWELIDKKRAEENAKKAEEVQAKIAKEKAAEEAEKVEDVQVTTEDEKTQQNEEEDANVVFSEHKEGEDYVIASKDGKTIIAECSYSSVEDDEEDEQDQSAVTEIQLNENYDNYNEVQWNNLKAKHPDAILMFRCGDFYEIYNDDADIASLVLGIYLTLQNGHKMCGFPCHAIDTYLPKFVANKHRVAICDCIKEEKTIAKRPTITETIQPTEEPQLPF